MKDLILEVDDRLPEDKQARLRQVAQQHKEGTLRANAPRPDFENAEKLHEEYPDTFDIPSRKKRKNVPIGCFVKSMLNDERFFTQVVDRFCVNGKVRYVGIVSNDLLHQNGEIDFGDPVIVKPEHIINILDATAGVPNPPPWSVGWTPGSVNRI